jgi:hypothetical protein
MVPISEQSEAKINELKIKFRSKSRTDAFDTGSKKSKDKNS